MGKITFFGFLLGFVNFHVDSQNLANILGNFPVVGRFLQDIELDSTFFNIPFIYNDVTQIKFILYTKSKYAANVKNYCFSAVLYSLTKEAPAFLPNEEVIIYKHVFICSPETGHELVLENDRTFERSNWNPSYPVKILIHGYAQSGYSKDFPKSLKDAYLDYGVPKKIDGFLSNNLEDIEMGIPENGTYNVICLDWSLLSKELIYFSSAVHTEKVGQRVGQFVMYLKEKRYIKNFDAIHLIGFSLGSHVAGVAGNFIQQATNGSASVGRITGLDPAGPGFTTVPLRLRLDPGDGEFVDIIHSNSGNVFLAQYGTAVPLGHVDFFPNGGARQPACEASFFREFTIPRRLACNHLKSAEYFRRTIRGEVFIGCWCESWRLYQEGVCNCTQPNATAIMGEYCDENTRGRYYLYLD